MTLDIMYSQIIQEERHLNSMRLHEERAPTLGLSTTTYSQQTLSRPTEQESATKFTRPATACTHCGRTGHNTSTCFQLVDFSEWWTDKRKSNGGRGSDRLVQGRGRGGRGSGFRANNNSS